MSDAGDGADDRWWLLPNLGAEEGPDWRRFADLAPVAATARLWRCLFPAAQALLASPGGDDEPGADWPAALGPRPPGAAFAWIDRTPGAHAWLGDADAARTVEASAPGAAGRRAWTGPDPSITRRVHDKAFAVRTAAALGYEARPLRGTILVLDAGTLREPDRAIAEIEARLAAWPPWARAFALKPRHGGSGRGRLGGRRDAVDRAALRRAFPRLAARGGAVLEPWLARAADFSVALHVAPGAADRPPVTVLGSLEQLVSEAGVPLGHVGELDSRGRVFTGSAWEEDVREAAVAVADAAREAGYFGPCGVDAFSFVLPDEADADEPPRPRLRPVVELNARFTLGAVTIGLVRRLLGPVGRALDLRPGERRAFLFALSPPADAPDWATAAACAGPDALGIDLGPGGGAGAGDRTARADAPADGQAPAAPGLVFARDRAALAALRPG